jgi:hypothetical protein
MLSNQVILDQSIKQHPGCIKYDLQAIQHPSYPNGIIGLCVQFTKEGHSGSSVFSAVLYASVTDSVFANKSVEGMAVSLQYCPIS